jgi:hypothetical protein
MAADKTAATRAVPPRAGLVQILILKFPCRQATVTKTYGIATTSSIPLARQGIHTSWMVTVPEHRQFC